MALQSQRGTGTETVTRVNAPTMARAAFSSLVSSNLFSSEVDWVGFPFFLGLGRSLVWNERLKNTLLCPWI